MMNTVKDKRKMKINKLITSASNIRVNYWAPLRIRDGVQRRILRQNLRSIRIIVMLRKLSDSDDNAECMQLLGFEQSFIEDSDSDEDDKTTKRMKPPFNKVQKLEIKYKHRIPDKRLKGEELHIKQEIQNDNTAEEPLNERMYNGMVTMTWEWTSEQH